MLQRLIRLWPFRFLKTGCVWTSWTIMGNFQKMSSKTRCTIFTISLRSLTISKKPLKLRVNFMKTPSFTCKKNLKKIERPKIYKNNKIKSSKRKIKEKSTKKSKRLNEFNKYFWFKFKIKNFWPLFFIFPSLRWRTTHLIIFMGYVIYLQ